VGNVPPFGHRTRLPVIIDAAVAAFAHCYAGGGSDAAEIFIAVPELLRAAVATVADISMPATTSSGGGTDPSSNNGSSQSALAEAAAEQRAAAVAAAAALPLPWHPGAGGEEEEVTLEGVVAHKRKIARLLLFAHLVPFSALVNSSIDSPAAGGGGGQGRAVAMAPAAAVAAAQGRHPTCAACGATQTPRQHVRCRSSWEKHWSADWAGTEAAAGAGCWRQPPLAANNLAGLVVRARSACNPAMRCMSCPQLRHSLPAALQ
jgi:hypothetical protein